MSWGLSLDEAIRFHGHLGPWLVIGYRAGVLAKSKLEPKDFHDIQCIVRVPSRIPYSCSIDGVQTSACCTLGKGNIVVEDCEGFEFIFINKVSKEVLRLKLRREVLDRLLSFKSIEEAVDYVKGLKDWELFELS